MAEKIIVFDSGMTVAITGKRAFADMLEV